MNHSSSEDLRPGETFGYGPSEEGPITDGYTNRANAVADGFSEFSENDPEEFPSVTTMIVQKATHADYFPKAADIIEHMTERGSDDGGEFADTYLDDITPEIRAEFETELAQFFNSFFTKHAIGTPRFYQNIRSEQVHRYEEKTA